MVKNRAKDVIKFVEIVLYFLYVDLRIRKVTQRLRFQVSQTIISPSYKVNPYFIPQFISDGFLRTPFMSYFFLNTSVSYNMFLKSLCLYATNFGPRSQG